MKVKCAFYKSKARINSYSYVALCSERLRREGVKMCVLGQCVMWDQH